ncbi:MAG: (Fe-S)-binding protein [Desulfurella sp.]|uniref:(Fe-S)-binding protein n=1 Tax=Desulfurella sp. TaxID=1962857 RepID=UPI003D1177CA
MKDNKVDEIVKELKELEPLIMQCSKCGTCQSVCPIYDKDLIETSVARGKLALIEAIYEGRIEEAQRIFKHLDYCVMCTRCKQYCPSGVSTDEIFLRAKSILRKIKELPNWQKAVLKIIMQKPTLVAKTAPLMHIGLKFGSKQVKEDVFKPLFKEFSQRNIVSIKSRPFTSKYGGLNKAKEEKMRVIFYPGCAITYIYTNWGEAIVEVLNYYGVSVYVPKTNKCCGIPAATMGDLDLYKQMVNKNLDWFDSIEDASYIITACPTCQYGLNDMGQKITKRKAKVPMMDIVVFLKEVLSIDIEPQEEEKSTLHIPCHYEREKDNTLKEFMSKNIAKDFSSLENQSCCGFGGTFNIKYYKDSSEIPKSKTQEIKEKGFKKLFTPCPGCAMQLSDVLIKENLDTKVMHPIEVIYEGIKSQAK